MIFELPPRMSVNHGCWGGGHGTAVSLPNIVFKQIDRYFGVGQGRPCPYNFYNSVRRILRIASVIMTADSTRYRIVNVIHGETSETVAPLLLSVCV